MAAVSRVLALKSVCGAACVCHGQLVRFAYARLELNSGCFCGMLCGVLCCRRLFLLPCLGCGVGWIPCSSAWAIGEVSQLIVAGWAAEVRAQGDGTEYDFFVYGEYF